MHALSLLCTLLNQLITSYSADLDTMARHACYCRHYICCGCSCCGCQPDIHHIMSSWAMPNQSPLVGIAESFTVPLKMILCECHYLLHPRFLSHVCLQYRYLGGFCCYCVDVGCVLCRYDVLGPIGWLVLTRHCSQSRPSSMEQLDRGEAPRI